MNDPAKASRAGFLRRLGALVIDVLIMLTMVTLIGVTLSKMSDGAVRVQSTIIKSTRCETLDALPAGLDLPRGFKPTSITACTLSFLSIPYTWTVKAENLTEQAISIGGTEYTTSKKLSYTYSLDPQGRPADPIEIDEFSFALYGLYFIALEWLFGRTLGQRLLRMRVQAVNGGAISLVQAVKRFVIRFGWLPLVPIGQSLLQSSPDRLVEIVVSFSVLNAAILVAILVNATRRIPHGELAWHDRWAQTEIVRAGVAA